MDKISELRKIINKNIENELNYSGHLSDVDFVADMLQLEKKLCALYN